MTAQMIQHTGATPPNPPLRGAVRPSATPPTSRAEGTPPPPQPDAAARRLRTPPRESDAAARRRRRDDWGLTTLEWLLIVAAVAGLAALAVVLVQNVVDDTAEQISGSSARLTAANVAAAEITSDAQELPTDDKSAQAKSKCERLRITYGDALDNSSPKKKPQWYGADITAAAGADNAAKEANARTKKLPLVNGKQQITALAKNTCLIVDDASPSAPTA